MGLQYELKEIKTMAGELWELAKAYRVWAFHGEMGNGKTTLIHAICEFLQVKDAVSSPTFAIINEYKSPVAGTIYHMDWYRMKDEEEAIQAGIDDSLQSNHYCFIEWPERAEGLLPENTLHIHLQVVDAATRQIHLMQ